MDKQKHQGSFWGLVPLLVFLVLYVITGITTNNFNSMPLMIGIMIASAIALLMPKAGVKKQYLSLKRSLSTALVVAITA